MNIKKLSALFLCVAFIGAVFTGCGADKAGNKKEAEVKDIRVGMLTHLNASEQKINEIMKNIDNNTASIAKLSRNYIYYDKLTSMVMGLESGSIDEMSLYDSVAKYLIGKNDKLQIIERPGIKLQDSFCFALRKEDDALEKDLNQTIEIMRSDGTLDKLVKTYITDLKPGEDPPAVEIPKIAGAPTVKIAVTGDLPPLDLVLANGKPAGFNTAVIAELSKRLNKNMEIIQVDSAARATALTSKKVDIVFWATVPYGETGFPADIDKPGDLDVTVPYYMDNIVHVGFKK